MEKVCGRNFKYDVGQPEVLSEGDVTRIEWLHALTTTFKMSVEEDNYPDNYFSDIDSASEYYYDVMLATEFGLIDIEAGEPLYPEAPATREFAAYTMNACMGYILEEENYTFSEVDSVVYPADIQIAINHGWLVMSGNEFLPEQGITQAEMEHMIAEAEKVVASVEINQDYNNQYQLVEGVVVVPEEIEVVLTNENELTFYSTTTGVSKNDIFVVVSNGFPIARRAVSVTVADGKTVIIVEEVEMSEAFTDIDAQGTLEADLTQVQAVDNSVQLTYIVGGTAENEYEDGTTFYSLDEVGEQEVSAVVATKTMAGKARSDSAADFSVKCKITKVSADYNVSLLGQEAYFNVSGIATFSFSASTDDLTTFDLEESFVRVPIAVIGYFEPRMEGSVSGSMSLSMKGKLSAGVQWTGENGVRLNCDFKKQAFTLQAKVEAKIGMKAAIGIDVVFAKAELYANAGAKAHAEIIKYVDNKYPTECRHIAAHMYASVGGKVSFKLIGIKTEVAVEETIFNEKNSPVKVVLHYENGLPVSECTRDVMEDDSGDRTGSGSRSGSSGGSSTGSTKKYKYYTPIDSQYAYSGANTGVSSTGETYTIFEYSLDDNNQATITKYNGNVSALTIPETIDGYAVVGIGSSVFKNNTRLIQVTIPNSVIAIGNFAFSKCTNLVEVILSNSLETIGREAFGECEGITEIEIPKSLTAGNTYYETNDRGPFYDCSNLKNVKFEEGTTEIASELFTGCTGIEEITIPNTVTVIEHSAFEGCLNLKKVVFSNRLTQIDYDAFLDCASLLSLDIPNSVMTIGKNAFFGCENLVSAIIADSVSTMGNAIFSGCTSLETVKLPSGRKNIMENMFYNCESLTTINIPSTLTNIQKNAFYGCKSLKEVILPSGLQSIENNAFYTCEGLVKIFVPDSVTSIGGSAFYGCESLTDVTLGTGLKKINNQTFYGCASLYSIAIPYNVESIGDSAFVNCTSFSQITIPRKTISIASNAFSYPKKMTIYGCSNSYAQEYAAQKGIKFVAQDIPATSVELNVTSKSLIKRETLQLSATITPNNCTDEVLWTSSNEKVATVTSDGLIKAIADGTAVITVTVGEKQATCTITVGKKENADNGNTDSGNNSGSNDNGNSDTGSSNSGGTSSGGSNNGTTNKPSTHSNGWQEVNGAKYWYENGVKQGMEGRGKEIYDPVSDAWYWLDNVDGGKKATSKDVYQESLAGDWGDIIGEDGQKYGKWVRYDAEGHMIKGWQHTNNGTYFFDYTYGTMAKGKAVIEGQTYCFDEATGVLK